MSFEYELEYPIVAGVEVWCPRCEVKAPVRSAVPGHYRVRCHGVAIEQLFGTDQLQPRAMEMWNR